MVECSFCGEEIDEGRGKIFVKKDGTALALCSRKCEMNQLKLKRNPRKTKWTSDYQSHKAKPKKEKQEKKEEVKKEKKQKQENEKVKEKKQKKSKKKLKRSKKRTAIKAKKKGGA